MSDPSHRLTGEHADLYAYTQTHTHLCTPITTCYIAGVSTHKPSQTSVHKHGCTTCIHVRLHAVKYRPTEGEGATLPLVEFKHAFLCSLEGSLHCPNKRGSPSSCITYYISCCPTAWAPSIAPAPGPRGATGLSFRLCIYWSPDASCPRKWGDLERGGFLQPRTLYKGEGSPGSCQYLHSTRWEGEGSVGSPGTDAQLPSPQAP